MAKLICRIPVIIFAYLSVITFPVFSASYSAGSTSHTDKILVCTEQSEPFMTRTFDANVPGILKAYTFSGDVEVVGSSDTDKVKIELYRHRGYSFWSGSQNMDNYRITMKQEGNMVVTSVERKSKEMGFFSDQITFSYKIYLPREMSAELSTSAGNIMVIGLQGMQSIKSNAGNITVQEVRGGIEAFTSGGNISISNSDGKIYGQTNGGNIRLENSRGDLRFRTNGGEIVANRISGSMLSEVNGGNIRAHFIHIAKGIDLQTSAGNISVILPERVGFDVEMSGIDFNFSSELNVDWKRRNGTYVGKIRNGGAQINLRANVGRISLNVDDNHRHRWEN